MNVLTFDTETTGLDATTSQVVELCLLAQFHTGPADNSLNQECQTWRINPGAGAEMSAEAEAVHGISLSDLAECLTFARLCDTILPYFERADVLVGYNVMFDINMVVEEFHRCGVTLDVKDKLIVDPLRLWYHTEKRDLQSAHERFTGRALVGAHAAAVDVRAVDDVLVGMTEEWGLHEKSWEELADLCEPDRHTFVGTTNHFLYDNGTIVIGFGKHKGQPAASNKGYLQWMLNSTFPSSVKNTARKILKGEL